MFHITLKRYNGNINEILDSIYQQYKNSVESVMINSLGNIILEPKSIAEAEPEVVDELINWCEENLESGKIGELFPEIPCLSDGSIIRHSDSFPIRQLQSIQLDDLFKRLEDGGVYHEYLKSELEFAKLPNHPLIGGDICVLLLENEENITKDKVHVLLGKLITNGGKIKVAKSDDSRIEYYQEYANARADIFIVTPETSVEEIREFILQQCGGKELDNKDYKIIKHFADEGLHNLFPGKVSVWQSESFSEEVDAIIRVPKFDRDNLRSISYIQGYNDHVPTGFVGVPSSGIQPKEGKKQVGGNQNLCQK